MAQASRPEGTPRATVAKGGIKTSTLAGAAGVLGGQHMGGHSDVSAAAEQMLRKDMAAGKVKNLDAERQMIFKKTGGYANGYTN